MIKKTVKYADKPMFPNISNPMEGELKVEYGKMLVRMSKQIGQKLSKVL
jgi:hypothetical protein